MNSQKYFCAETGVKLEVGDKIYKGAIIATITAMNGTDYALVTFHSGVGLFAGRQDWVRLKGWEVLGNGSQRTSYSVQVEPADPRTKSIRP